MGAHSQTRCCQLIFIVDDEPMIASSLEKILKIEGFDVLAFTNPLQALDALHNRTADLLITDVFMPFVSGIELAIKARRICPDCKVLLFSAQPRAADLLEAAKAVGHHFEILAKPIHPSELISKIRWELELNFG